MLTHILNQGTWTKRFDKSLTKPGKFIFVGKSGTRKLDCNMMTRPAETTLAASTELLSCIALSYGPKARFLALILLPDEGVAMEQVIDTLTADMWNNLIASLRGKAR